MFMSPELVTTSDGRAESLHGRLLNVLRLAVFGEMTAGVAHELNQPLTAIMNYSHACERLLAAAVSDPLQLREALQQIAAQAQRAADIVQRLRNLAATQPSAERQPTSLNAVVEELRELIETNARLHGVRVTLDLAPNLPEVLVDAGRIQYAVLNLVQNSLEALALRPTADATIGIKTSTAEDAVELAVSDNGPGVAPDVEQRAFDPFFSTKPNGLGLGLAVNRSIARAHRGSVGYRPNQPTGACFYIAVPVWTPE
jgi:C4-dicarboxylate-specific signal transduction histidine kinase